MLTELQRGVRFTLVTMALLGGAYHVALRMVGRLAFSGQADGSLIRRTDGSVIGSTLIAQAFARPEYFHPRPSAVDYNAASTGGSNFGPSNPQHLELVKARLAAVMAAESAPAGQVSSELITASGRGLDPHLRPAAAYLQAPRVAAARGLHPDRLRGLIDAHTERAAFGFLGQPRVNVLALNLALDALSESIPDQR